MMETAIQQHRLEISSPLDQRSLLSAGGSQTSESSVPLQTEFLTSLPTVADDADRAESESLRVLDAVDQYIAAFVESASMLRARLSVTRNACLAISLAMGMAFVALVVAIIVEK